MAHWAFRRLSGLLAREGFHVMRFDWSGTGDSWGRTNDGTMPRWLDDIAVALQELRDASGARSITTVGMRLGAAIAAQATAAGLKVEDLVLWEPVVSGSTYLAELEVLDFTENLRLLHQVSVAPNELMGFPFPVELRAAIARIDLRTTLPRVTNSIAILSAIEREDHRQLYTALLSAQTKAVYSCVPEDPSANKGRGDTALLANRSLTAIANHVAGTPND